MTSLPSPENIKTPNIGNSVDVQVAPQNLTRAQLYVFNPGPNVIWVAPSLNNDGTNNSAVAAGVGSVPVQPSQGIIFPGFTGAMRAIAASGATNTLTIWEYYP